MNKSVYLAGPIGNCTYGEATDWRKDAQSRLATIDVTGYSPMRGKEYLDTQSRISGAAATSILCQHPKALCHGISTTRLPAT